jgi:DNA polymerase III alpha subunit (gram-positive type)
MAIHDSRLTTYDSRIMYLNNHSYYSLRYGTMSLEELVDTAVENGVKAMALTDINNSTGIMDFVRLASKAGIAPIAPALPAPVRQCFCHLSFRDKNTVPAPG